MTSPLVHDWNPAPAAAGRVALLDETLRDGLQSPSVRQPSLDEKAELLGLMDGLGVDVVKLGMPSVSSRIRDDCSALARYVAKNRLSLELACSARAVPADVEDVARVAQRSGRAVAAYVFIATSAIRARTEGWDAHAVRTLLAAAFETARRERLPLTFVAEDATRTGPETLRELLRFVAAEGVQRVCLCDSTGSATPEGALGLVRFARAELDSAGGNVGLDWHGHDDRGLAVASALAASRAGADRLHATALGVGERAGNVAMEVLVLNLALESATRAHPERLGAYCHAAARALGVAVPHGHPVTGRDAFRTAAGTHAAAIAKAEAQGDPWITDRIYSAFPASWVGEKHSVEIGALSGERAVVHWLSLHGLPAEPALVRAMLTAAKASDRILPDAELWAVVRAHRTSLAVSGPDPRR